MGQLAELFEVELVKAGFGLLPRAGRLSLGSASTYGLPAGVRSAIIDLHRGLGGVSDYSNFTSGKWDIATADRLFIEFDEQLHFNRYRQRTGQLPWTSVLPWTPAYARFNADHEDACLKAGSYGGKWTSPSTEKMFGAGDPPGILGEYGSPRWKQRALYDAVKDAYALHTPGIALARVSLHDQIGGANVHQALKGAGLDPNALHEFVAARSTR